MAESSSTYTINILSIPDDPQISAKLVQKYAALRLASLKTNPEAFGSRWEDQIHFSQDEWRSILDTRSKAFTIARVGQAVSCAVGVDAEWIGLLVIHPQAELEKKFGSEWVAGLLSLPPASLQDRRIEIYFLTSMWVHPEHRRGGVATRLVQQGVQWIRKHPGRPAYRDENRVKVLVLQVHEDNASARSFYRRMGFVDAGASRDEVGERDMVMIVGDEH